MEYKEGQQVKLCSLEEARAIEGNYSFLSVSIISIMHKFFDTEVTINSVIDANEVTILEDGGMCRFSTSWLRPLEPDTAKRFNTEKVDLSFIPIYATEEECKVWMMGEKKYGRDNWKKLWGDRTVPSVMASLLRHAFAILRGEDIDTESQLHHAAHIRCNAAMILEYYRRKQAGELE